MHLSILLYHHVTHRNTMAPAFSSWAFVWCLLSLHSLFRFPMREGDKFIQGDLLDKRSICNRALLRPFFPAAWKNISYMSIHCASIMAMEILTSKSNHVCCCQLMLTLVAGRSRQPCLAKSFRLVFCPNFVFIFLPSTFFSSSIKVLVNFPHLSCCWRFLVEINLVIHWMVF